MTGYPSQASPLTVPIHWSYDRMCPHDRSQYEHNMHFDQTDGGPQNNVQKDDRYLKKHEGLFFFNAALIAVRFLIPSSPKLQDHADCSSS